MKHTELNQQIKDLQILIDEGQKTISINQVQEWLISLSTEAEVIKQRINTNLGILEMNTKTSQAETRTIFESAKENLTDYQITDTEQYLLGQWVKNQQNLIKDIKNTADRLEGK